jgi:hypothetical protein
VRNLDITGDITFCNYISTAAAPPALADQLPESVIPRGSHSELGNPAGELMNSHLREDPESTLIPGLQRRRL